MSHYHYTYLIVGGGMAADAAVRGIREVDPNRDIGLISTEPDPPYKRPPLSKKLWQGKALESIWLGTGARGVDLHPGRTARVLDLHQKRVVDDRGTVYDFDRLLLATGVSPRRLPIGGHRVIYYRTLQDYHRLRQETAQGQHFAVIGGGFIGSEVAAALISNGKNVTMIFPEPGIGARLFPPDLSSFVTDYYRDHGVEVLPGASLTGITERDDHLLLTVTGAGLTTPREIAVDGIVAGIGARPNTDLALAAGLEVDNGILVDSYLRTSHADVFAAGDVAAFWQDALKTRRRVEHEDNALTMGRHAGRAMAGEPALYEHLPFFYSDLFDLGYEAVGELDARLETAADWQEPYRTGVITYRREGLVRGMLLWNVWDQVDTARAAIRGGQSTERTASPLAAAGLV